MLVSMSTYLVSKMVFCSPAHGRLPRFFARFFARFTNSNAPCQQVGERVLTRFVSLTGPSTAEDHALEALGRSQDLRRLGFAVWLVSRMKARILDYVFCGRGLRVSCCTGYRAICGVAGHQDVIVDVAAGVGNALNVAHFVFLCGV